MNALRQEKEAIVSEIQSKLSSAKATVFMEYHGLTVEAITNLRNELRAEGSEMKVYKNRLVKIAAENAGFGELAAQLTGPNAVIFGNEDEVAPARIVAKFAKEFDVIKFKTGVFEGKVIGIDMLTELANVPSRETLLTQIASGLLQPITEVARGLTMLEESHVSGAGTPAVETATEEVKEEAKEDEVAPEATTEEAPAEAAATEETTEEAPVTEEVTEEAKEETAE